MLIFHICTVLVYMVFALLLASNEIDSFANELRESLHVKHEKFNFLTEKKDMLKREKSLGLELWDSNSETFHGIFVIQGVDRSTKPVVVVFFILLHIYTSTA